SSASTRRRGSRWKISSTKSSSSIATTANGARRAPAKPARRGALRSKRGADGGEIDDQAGNHRRTTGAPPQDYPSRVRDDRQGDVRRDGQLAGVRRADRNPRLRQLRGEAASRAARPQSQDRAVGQSRRQADSVFPGGQGTPNRS